VNREILYQSLPTPHQRYVEIGIDRMLASDLLISTTQQDGVILTLNPDMLAYAQALINREVTPFWAGIITSSG
jgi:hypothetical protein